MTQSGPEETLNDRRPFVAVHHVNVPLAYERRQLAADVSRWKTPNEGNFDVLKTELADKFDHRSLLGQHDDLMSHVANRTGQLHGVELRSTDFHGVRVDEYPHATRPNARAGRTALYNIFIERFSNDRIVVKLRKFILL